MYELMRVDEAKMVCHNHNLWRDVASAQRDQPTGLRCDRMYVIY